MEAKIGRRPRSAYRVAVRDDEGNPAVIANPPFLDDGTPMPTRYWLVDPALCRLAGTLESIGGVKRSEAEVDGNELAASHRAYERERDAMIDEGYVGPRPSGGVGGTRQGVKCLHTHLAWYLAGGDDPIGRWALDNLGDPLWLKTQRWILRRHQPTEGTT